MAKAALKAWSGFLAAHALALRGIEERLKAAGSPPLDWYDVLLELDRAGGRLRIGDLAARVVIAPYNMTRLLDRLEKEGLLCRERAVEDRRGAFAVLTEKGRALRRSAWPAYERAIREVMAPLTEAEAESLARLMAKLILPLRAGRRGAGGS
jgi:DNA-binding MarR family transcriptional regulator